MGGDPPKSFAFFFPYQKYENFGQNLFSISFAGGGWGSGKSVKNFMFSFHFAPFPRWKAKKFFEGKKFVSTVGAHGRRPREDGEGPSLKQSSVDQQINWNLR